MYTSTLAVDKLFFNGLVREIYDDLILNCGGNPQFAIGCALTIVGAVCQRSYTFPKHFSCNLYTVLHAPASTGKEAFIERSKKIIRSVSVKIESPEPRSGEALKVILNEYPTRCFMPDEFWKKYGAAYDKNKDSQAYTIITKLLELYNNRKVLEGSKTKKETIPDTEYPRTSMLSTTTFVGLQRVLAKEEFISDGMLSRLCIFINNETSLKDLDFDAASDPEVPEPIRYQLRQLFYGKGIDTDKLDNDCPRFHSNVTLSSTAKYELSMSTEKFRSRHELMGEDELAEGGHSVVARGMDRMRKFAAIHCLGRGDTEIGMVDIMFAESLALQLVDQDLSLLDVEAVSVHEKVMAAIEATVAKYGIAGMTAGQIANSTHTLRKQICDVTERMRILSAMVSMGRISMYQPESGASRFFPAQKEGILRAIQ